MDFWATWCRPCVGEIPHLKDVHDEFGDKGLEIVGISLDSVQRISRVRVERFVKQNSVTWDQVYKDAESIADRFRVRAIPAMFLIDGDTGAILASGDELRGSALQKTIAAKLRTKGPT